MVMPVVIMMVVVMMVLTSRWREMLWGTRLQMLPWESPRWRKMLLFQKMLWKWRRFIYTMLPLQKKQKQEQQQQQQQQQQQRQRLP